MAQKHDVAIIEDDPYMYLLNAQRDGGDEPAGLFGLACAGAGPDDRCSMLSIDADARVVRMDTFSKFLAPGLRCSWITLPKSLADAASHASHANTKTGSTLAQITMHEILKTWGDEGLHKHLMDVQSFYRQRASVLDHYATKHLTGLAEWEAPDCSMFFWMKFNGVDDTGKLLKAFMDEKLAVVPGKYFVADADPDAHYDCSFVRMAYTVASDDAFDRGMQRIRSIILNFFKANGIAPPSPEAVEAKASAKAKAAARPRRAAAAAPRAAAAGTA